MCQGWIQNWFMEVFLFKNLIVFFFFVIILWFFRKNMQTDSNKSKIEKYKNNKVVREYEITDDKNNNKVYKGKYFVASFFPTKDITPERFEGNKTNIKNATCFATYNDQVLTAPFNYLDVGYILGDFNYKGCFMEDSFSDQLPNIESDQRTLDRLNKLSEEQQGKIGIRPYMLGEGITHLLKKKHNERDPKNLVSNTNKTNPITRLIKKQNRYLEKCPFNQIDIGRLRNFDGVTNEFGVNSGMPTKQIGHYTYGDGTPATYGNMEKVPRTLVHNDIVLDKQQPVKVLSLVIREHVNDNMRVFHGDQALKIINVSLKNIKNNNVVILTGGKKKERKILETSIENAILRDFLIYKGREPSEKYKDNQKAYKNIKLNYDDEFAKKYNLDNRTKEKLKDKTKKEKIIDIIREDSGIKEKINDGIGRKINELKCNNDSLSQIINLPWTGENVKQTYRELITKNEEQIKKFETDNNTINNYTEELLSSYADEFLKIKEEYLLPEKLIKYVKECREQNSTLYKIKGFFKNLFGFNYHDPNNKQAAFYTGIVNSNINTPFPF